MICLRLLRTGDYIEQFCESWLEVLAFAAWVLQGDDGKEWLAISVYGPNIDEAWGRGCDPHAEFLAHDIDNDPDRSNYVEFEL